jgi:glutathione S-transferase
MPLAEDHHRETVMHPHFLLYGNRESGHSYKVALFLSLAGLPFDYRPIDIHMPREQRAADFREAARYGEVPTLMIDGTAWVQSDAILLGLIERTGRFDGGTPVARQRVREWLFWEANRLGFSFPHIRFEHRFGTGMAPEVMAWLRTRCEADLATLDAALRDQPFLLGSSPTAADIACCGYLYWAEQGKVDLADYPAIAQWLARIAALPGYKPPYEMFPV